MNLKKEDIGLHEHLSKEYVDKRYIQEYSKYYQKHWNGKLISLLPQDLDFNVLDFGCGTGILLQDIDKLYKSSCGLDISRHMLEYARNTCKNSDLIIGDGEQLPFFDETWNAVVCRGAVHHIPNPQKALNEMYRILTPGGALVISEPSIDSILMRLIRILLYKNSKKFSKGHKAFKSKHLTKILQKSGFTVIEVKFFGYIAYPLCGFPDFIPLLNYIPFNRYITKLLILLDKLLSYIPLVRKQSWQVIILAKK